MGSMSSKSISTKDEKVGDPRGGLGLRFWNFLERVSLGPDRDAVVGRRTGGRI
jgi:hypothetical protein